MARALRNEINITGRFISGEPLTDDDLEMLESTVRDFLGDLGYDITVEVDHDDEGISI